MLLEVRNLKQNVLEDVPLEALAAKKLGISINEIYLKKILRRSLDARRKDQISFVWSVLFEVPQHNVAKQLLKKKDVFNYLPEEALLLSPGVEVMRDRPVIVGSGPAGLFAGLTLAKYGYRPLILERGYDVDRRTRVVEQFSATGSFDVLSNIQFGEGGAGTFSDGKLTTRIKDRRCDDVLRIFAELGAPLEITYAYKPHIGTDILRKVVKNMRKQIEALGGEVRFASHVTDLSIQNNQVNVLIVNNTERINCGVVGLAIGHSARDTYQMLYKKGIQMEPKAFSIGVRIEHLQEWIDRAQYGDPCLANRLGPADYQLSYRSEQTGRAVYSFCMCPGGLVVPAASEECRLVVNGMSEYARNQKNANSAIVVSVSPSDFESRLPLDAIAYQRNWEELAYQTGGGGYAAPVQLVGDFLKNQKSTKFGKVQPSYCPGTRFAQLEEYLPQYITDTLREGLLEFGKKIKGFDIEDAVLTGVETRTSAPVRILRNGQMLATGIENLYPIGEGAGYAGGIVSAAVDGIKFAETMIRRFTPWSGA